MYRVVSGFLQILKTNLWYLYPTLYMYISNNLCLVTHLTKEINKQELGTGGFFKVVVLP